MEPKEWTADIRLTLIRRLAEQLVTSNLSRLECDEIAARIWNISSQSDAWLNNHYGDVMNGHFSAVSARLTWPTLNDE